MKRLSPRLVVYLFVLGLLAGLMVAAPSAWATPDQAHSEQTVPTRTRPAPTQPPATLPPATRPPATDKPPATGAPPPATGAPPPAGTPTPGLPITTGVPAGTVTAGPRAVLVLIKEAGRSRVWPGSTVPFTLTLVNQGMASARQVLLTDPLPPELDPGNLSGDGEAAWNARVLQLRVPVLAPGAEVSVVFTTTVNSSAVSGGVIPNVASATAAGGLKVSARAEVALPPAELPATGCSASAALTRERLGR